MDDCIIMTGPREEALHEEIAHMFFDLLEQHSLFLKPAKCEFFKLAMDYLGICVQRGELMIDPAKITGITNWPTVMEITPMMTGKSLPCIVKTGHSLFLIVCSYL